MTLWYAFWNFGTGPCCHTVGVTLDAFVIRPAGPGGAASGPGAPNSQQHSKDHDAHAGKPKTPGRHGRHSSCAHVLVTQGTQRKTY